MVKGKSMEEKGKGITGRKRGGRKERGERRVGKRGEKGWMGMTNRVRIGHTKASLGQWFPCPASLKLRKSQD